jgi:hypothetical protein
MMIGPAPMMRMLWMSVRLGIYFFSACFSVMSAVKRSKR